ncbi:MAG: hypothetical protein PVH82_12265 [Desulfobacteraceae bacterium]|jgi:hypothetical protein
MSHAEARIKHRRKMAIIASYFTGETYGLLGPQMAATIIQGNMPYDCIVVTVAREDDKTILKKALAEYFGAERPIVGFSLLSGRQDLFTLAEELKDEGALTFLAGPQADVDYLGEPNWQIYPHRFPGLSKNFSFSLPGPAEQAIHLLRNLGGDGWHRSPGLLCLRENGELIKNPQKRWEEKFLDEMRWNNVYRVIEKGLVPLKIRTGQVLQQIGCPYATQERFVEIDNPVSSGNGAEKVRLPFRGCAFCDVAVDKGFYGALRMKTVVRQIRCLPERGDGRKIPFELINENPLPSLPRLLGALTEAAISVSQINLIMRADWFLKGEKHLRQALNLARDLGVRILLASVGFESFDDRILDNLNKGLSVEINLRAIRLMRGLKESFPLQWGYSREEGAIHGFIHPTPWDTQETSAKIQKTIDQHGLAVDILPHHSTPLIIHHASRLGDWIREIERRERIQFRRHGSIIEWWRVGERFTL